jgi:dipeptidyl aminopeptidase/acylaminoacyl peptidase
MLGALSLVFLASAAAGTPADLAAVRDGVVHVGSARVAAGSAPAVSPDGTAVAFVSVLDGNPELYVARLRGRRPVRITFTPRFAEADPDWSPDGKRLVYEAGGDLHVTRLDRAGTRLLVRRARTPAWSPDGRWITCERAETIVLLSPAGTGGRRLVSGSEPAWSPDGKRLVYELESDLYVTRVDRPHPRLLTEGAHSPTWGPNGRIAFEAAGTVWAVREPGGPAVQLGRGSAPDWRARPKVRALLPDLDQLAPSRLSVAVAYRRGQTRFLLGFRSAVANIGAGPLELVASRPSESLPVLTASQRVRLSAGGVRSHSGVGSFRYVRADTHVHWHYLAFQRYELRRPDDSLVVRDRKSGFCLVDRRGPRGRRPVFTGNCASHDSRALRLRAGTSPGYVDIYPGHFHGQNLDITGLPAGRYVLVHRANPLLLLWEADYTNNAASVLVRLSWPRGTRATPDVRILRHCATDDRCAAGYAR